MRPSKPTLVQSAKPGLWLGFSHVWVSLTWIAALGMLANVSFADVQHDLARLQQRWAEVNYQVAGKARLTSFELLAEAADGITREYPNSAQAWTWSGIVKSSYAQARGGLRSLGLAKSARADLERAISLDEAVLDGLALISLGALYHNTRHWPFGFGNEKLAGELLRRGVALNPEGIDADYFYGAYLLDDKQFSLAREYLLKAQQAAPRPGREVADDGRKKEILAALAVINQKL